VKAKYIGPDDYAVGQVGFLIEHSNAHGGETWRLADLPAHTNQSH
jgi:hypothetical protein